jgi:DNA-binding IclR family transcriptional regulator
MKTRTKRIKSVETTVKIVESLEHHGEARLAELASDLNLSKSTVYRHLTTLREQRWVAKNGELYRVGSAFLRLGEHIRTRRETHQLAKTKVKQRASRTDERVQFLIEEHNEMVYICQESGENAVRTGSGIGETLPVHASAPGKVFLASLPDAEVRQVLETDSLATYTAHTVADMRELLNQLEEIRACGVAFNEQEYIRGLNGVSVPVSGVNGQFVGALAVAGPAHRLKEEWFEREIPDLLLGAANEIELKTIYD